MIGELCYIPNNIILSARFEVKDYFHVFECEIADFVATWGQQKHIVNTTQTYYVYMADIVCKQLIIIDTLFIFRCICVHLVNKKLNILSSLSLLLDPMAAVFQNPKLCPRSDKIHGHKKRISP